MNWSGEGARSISVTCVPSSEKIEAYSHPMTPPPMIVNERGR